MVLPSDDCVIGAHVQILDRASCTAIDPVEEFLHTSFYRHYLWKIQVSGSLDVVERIRKPDGRDGSDMSCTYPEFFFLGVGGISECL